jgi:hypothetical protein
MMALILFCLSFSQARIYRINAGTTPPSPSARPHGHRLVGRVYGNYDVEYIGYTGSYINRREVTLYLRVPAGKYLVIPSIYEVVR